MGKISVEQQVAELTAEQKSNMGKIYKKYILSVVLVALAGVLIAIGLFVEAGIKEEKAKDKYDGIQIQQELNELTNEYDFSLFDESIEALDAYHDAQRQKDTCLMIGSGVAFFGVLTVYFVFRKKYPYFSEKKYACLKKMERAQNAH